MSALEASFCRSAPWRLLARRVLPWATQGSSLAGRVLEIGGGGGAMAEAVIEAHPRVSLTTTDTDPAMVRAARRLLAGSAVETLEADATRLPFADESFDTVLSFLMLHHVIDWEQALAEAAESCDRAGHSWDTTCSPRAPQHGCIESTALRTGSSTPRRSNRR
jgi:ubiquinone/menaquinone biosynthesis C-methylase UbiE